MDVRLPDGTVIQNVPDNITKADLTAKLKNNGYDVSKLEGGQPEKAPLMERLGRQIGLTGRDLIEGAANTAGIISDPIIGAINGMTGGHNVTASQAGEMLADTLRLPKPENSTERVVGDISKTLVGTGGLIKGATSAAKLASSPIAKGALNAVSAAPGYQAAGAVGSGAGGGIARESGAGEGVQAAAALAGGLALPSATYATKAGAGNLKRMLSAVNPERVEAVVKQSVINLTDLPLDVANAIRDDVQKALKGGQNLSPDAVRRLADYHAVGATPTRGSLTIKPADVTRDRNLAKISANSSDPAAQKLANVANDNNERLISNLNSMGAETADDALTTGGKVISRLQQQDSKVKGAINNLYANARATNGRSAAIDPSAFTNRANDLLDEKLLGGKLPSDVRNKLNSVAKGETPLTVDVAEQLKTNIGALQRASRDPAERLALGQVRQALDEAPLLDGQGQAAINAFNKARKVNAAYMRMVDNTPALKAVRDGIEPDKFVQTFIIGNGSKSNLSDLKALRLAVSKDRDALQSIKDQIIVHLKNKALNNAADEVANFSPSAYNKALNDIGDAKLNVFFDKSDIDKLKQVGRVASYEKFQPTGSAVNNSNTAAAVFTSILDAVANSRLLRMVPFGGEIVANPAKNISTAVGARGSLNAANALKSNVPQPKVRKSLLLPALVGSSSLTTE